MAKPMRRFKKLAQDVDTKSCDEHRGHDLTGSHIEMEVDEVRSSETNFNEVLTSPELDEADGSNSILKIMAQLAFTPTFAEMKLLGSEGEKESPSTSAADTIIVGSQEQEAEALISGNL